MVVTVPVLRSEVRVLDLWNGSSNDSPTVDMLTPTYDDSAWAASANPGTPTTLRRYQGSTRLSDLAIGAQAVWPTVTPSNARQFAVIRWWFNPGPGPFTNAEFLFAAPSSTASASLFLNYDGLDNGTTASVSMATTGSIGSLAGFSAGLIPNAPNLLAIYVLVNLFEPDPWSGVAYFTVGFRFPDADLPTLPDVEYQQIPIRITEVKSQRVVPPALAEGLYPGWTVASYDDSAWPNAVLADHPLMSDPTMDSNWDIAAINSNSYPLPLPRGDAMWPIGIETDANAVAIFRIHFTVGPGLIRESSILGQPGLRNGTFITVLGSTPNSGRAWLNGAGPIALVVGFFEGALIENGHNVLAWTIPAESSAQTNGLAAGNGAWYEATIQLAYDTALIPPPPTSGRGRAFAQVIGD